MQCTGPREKHKVGMLCPGRASCESVMLTFDAFRLWLVHRVNRFAGSLALGQRVCDLLLFQCCVPWFAGLCFRSWTLPLRTAGRKLATAKKNNLVSLFERTDVFIGLCSKDLDESLYMSLNLIHKSSQEKGKKDAGRSPSYPKDYLGSKEGKK